jgi:predicted PurR-regulated permease PerM
MARTRRDLLSLVFSLAVIMAAAWITGRFVLPLLWAAILCIATWPLYLRVLRATRHPIPAAALVTLLGAAIFATPLVLGAIQVARQAPALADLVAEANNFGLAPPDWLSEIPFLGKGLQNWWQSTLGQPHGLGHLLSDSSVARLHSAPEVLKRVGSNVMHRLIDIAFAFLALFFFYKDGPALLRQLDTIGDDLIGERRWTLYATRVPTAVRATVNGLVLVGLAEGVLLGIGYELAKVPSAALWAAATGVLAIIPFGAPIAFGAVAALLFFRDDPVGGAAILAWGGAVLFVADHFVRPAIIGNATKLPFLAVLLGILGGVETLGLIGLFVGPVVMTLFVTLWQEERLFHQTAD